MYEPLSTSIVVQADSLGVETAAQMALRTGRVERRNILDEPSIEGSDQAVLLAEMQSLGWVWAVAVPLRVQSRVVGAMTCYMRPEDGLSDSDLSLLTTIADQVAVAVENARLAADAQKRAALEERLQAQDVLEKRVAAIAIENARLYKQAQAVAVLEERQRLARELHDSVSQALYAVALGAKTAHALLPRDPDGTAEALDYVLVQAEAGLTEMRALIFELRPQALESEGLIAALRQQVETVRVRHRIDVRAVLGAEPGISLDVKEALYRIAQEAVHNTVKHARARSIEIRLLEDAEGITLEVRDDGKGFEPDGSFPGHLGLRTMRERALRLGGTLNVTSAPGEGTSIRAVLPHTERRNESPAAEAG